MRKLFALAAIPLFSAAPVSVSISQAVVTWGAGVDPRREMPPGHFEARVLIAGSRRSARPSIRAWRVKIGDSLAQGQKIARCPSLKNASPLKLTVTCEIPGTWVIQGAWPGALEPEDRLVVKAYSGSRLLGWASSQPTEHLIPSGGRRPEPAP